MAGFKISPETITGKVHTRTPTQAQSLSSRYTFLNLQNAEPNLGKPGPAGTSPETTEGYLGLRYALLSNNNSNGLSAWRVWSFDNPRVAFYSIQNSLGIGENANPIRVNSIVYNNHPYGKNRYNSESLAANSFNVYSLSGIYLFDSTTVGDPASAVSLVVTESGNVGINTEFPCEILTVNGNISASGSLSAFASTGRWHLLAGSVNEGFGNVATGVASHAEGEDNIATGDASHAEGMFNEASGDASHAQGRGTTASGLYSHAAGENTWADGVCSHAIGHSSVVRNNWSFMWSDALSGTLTSGVSTTRSGQFAVSASGGVFIPGNVGIGTDNNSNSLTVAGAISSNGGITATGGNSNQWNSNYTTTNTNSANWILQNGNSFGGAMVIGTNDSYSVSVRTNGTQRLLITNTNHRFNGNVSLGTGADSSERLTVNGNISANGTITALGGNSDNWNSVYTTVRSISSIIPDPTTTIASQIAVGATTLNSINFLNTTTAQLLYTVPAGKTFLTTDYMIIIDSVAGGNVTDTSLPTFRLYKHDTLTNAANQVTNQLTPTTGTVITSDRYYRTGGSVVASPGKAIVSGNDASPQNKIWFKVDSSGTNTYTGLSGRAIVTGFLI